MNTHVLLEAAARSLLMGALVLVALRLLRIEQVRARRTAWLLALAGAMAMPVLVSAQIGPRLLPEFSVVEQLIAPHFAPHFAPPQRAPHALPTVYGIYRVQFPISQAGMVQDAATTSAAPAGADSDGTPFADTVLSLAVLGYCVVAAVLSLRLCAGVGFALRLRNRAERVCFPFDPELDVRTSERVSSPVTIGSSVLLPADYSAWDGATLRIVLSHERAHVRQKDFLIHALAGLHCALFWFNPFSWWLQRQLAELGEALSDCAAVEQAESRTGYAEVLLAFAARTRGPLIGVAMANASNLTPRIERLLSDRGFERSFAKAQRLPIIAAGAVALAMFASTSMVRVHASPADDVTPPAAPTPVTPSTVPSPPAPRAPTTPGALPAPASVSPPAPPAPEAPRLKKLAKVRQLANSDFKSDDDVGDDTVDEDDAVDEHGDALIEHDRHSRNEEGVLAIHSDHSHIMFDSGNRLPSLSGDYIYFQHNGKPYLIQDPQIIAKAQAMLEPMKDLGEQQKLLGHKQAMLGSQQRMLASQARAVKIVDTPEFKQRMAELQKTIKELDLPRLTAQVDERALEQVQAHLGEIQAQVGELQSQFGARMGEFGEQQGKLGEEQGKLGEQQALLGEKQRKLIEDVKRRLTPIIEQAIREGKGQLLVK